MNVQRVELLNKMYHNGDISRMNYELEFKKIIKDLREVGLEEEFLDFISELEIK